MKQAKFKRKTYFLQIIEERNTTFQQKQEPNPRMCLISIITYCIIYILQSFQEK